MDRAPVDPVAVVLLDLPVAHLDRTFEYAVPVALDETARPGVRVKVKFGAQDVSGYLIQRTATAEHVGELVPLRTVVSDEPVLTPEVLRLCRQVAVAQAGSLSDVVRLAVPPRHARAEAALPMDAAPPWTPALESSAAWARYPAGSALLRRIAEGEAPAASWLALPTVDPEADWPRALADAARTAMAAGRGVIITLPDHRDVERVAHELGELVGKDAFVRLTADQGPQARYTAWLKALRGQVRCVIGNRAAAFAPVHDLGLLVCWDDGDNLLAEPRAPYPHTRDVLWRRHVDTAAALVLGGFARSVAVEQWVQEGRLQSVHARPVRAQLPHFSVAGDDREVERHGAAAKARLPASAWQAVHDGLQHGPVLVQVPRRGYVPRLRCSTCGHGADCPVCHGPLQVRDADQTPRCSWCDTPAEHYRCPECDGATLRASVVGARRTAEELGRAFPGTPVVRSGAGQVLGRVPAASALVISTPGAEPVAESGYTAVLLLDGWAMVDRPSLASNEQALRQWMAASALCRPAATGGKVVLAGVDASVQVAQALLRWAPAALAGSELAARAALGLPPTRWTASLTGKAAEVAAAAATVPDWMTRLGPAPLPGEGDQVRLLVSADHAAARDAARAISALRAARSLARSKEPLAVRVDPDGSSL
ncbi:primosome assembly protein PriA [Yimella sp. cx-573]|nr:primosome assembly protein PriA [Yimella sp. cx-573]